MKIREEMLQSMYDMVNNEGLCENMQSRFVEAMDICAKYFPKDKEDDYMNALCNLDRAAFMAGANTVLDFIAGKEVE